MREIIKNMMAALLLFVGGTLSLHAQFSPVNPPEPNENIYYNVTVASSPANVAYTYGTGKFLEGTSRNVSYSLRNASYKFSHWSLNGEYYSDKSSFTYIVGAADAALVAHFDFVPALPQEPSASDEYKLTLASNNDAACSFNRNSSTRVKFDSFVTLAANVNQGYEFLGWYRNGVLVSGDATFNYQMPAEDVTLVAKFKYNPFNPSEPEGDGSQENVQTTPTGDVNKDGVVNVFDIVSIVNYSLAEADEQQDVYDVNGDGAVNVFDIVRIVNISLE